MNRARIVLVDDHELFRAGLAGLISAQPDLEIVGQASDGFEALTLARSLHPDLIVMDIKMPICNGLEATRLIRTESPTARILILTVHDEDQQLFDAIKAGASGYLLKDTHAADFLSGIRAILAGEAVLPAKLAARLLDEFARLASHTNSATPPADAHDLTTRECEVLRLIAAHASNKEIAEQLSLSLHTVKSHVCNILSKLHAANRRHAVRLAKEYGLVQE